MEEEKLFRRTLAAAAAALMLSASAATADDFYEGQTINVIINLGAGGSTGVMAQLFSQYWSKYIPGNPQFIVTPVEGGAQLQGITQVRNARPDGLTVGWVSWSAATRQVGPASQHVDWGAFDIIAGMGAQGLAYMRNDVPPGIERPEDILNAEGVQIGGYRPGSYLDLLARMSLDILGVEYGYTTGFGGGASIIAALQRNEVNFAAAPAANYFGNIDSNVVEEGIGLPLWYYAFSGEDGEPVADPAFGDIRAFHEVAESATGEAPSGPLWEAMQWLNDGSAGVTWLVAAPRGVDEERLQILREAFFKAAEDPEFLEAVERIAGLVPPVVDTEAMERIIENLGNVDDEIVTILQDYISSGAQ